MSSRPMLRIGLVVEGDTERRLFEALHEWFRQQGSEVKVVQAGGRPRLIQEARRQLEVMRLRGCQRTIFLLDQNDDPCPPSSAGLLDAVRREPDTAICVMARELEAWFLADAEAILKATGQSFTGQPTDELPEPAKRLKALFQRSQRGKSLTKVEMVVRLSPHFDLTRAARGNRSALRFWGQVQP